MGSADGLVNELARRRGIADSYTDIEGNVHRTSDATKRRLLAAMGLDVRTREGVARALEDERRRGDDRLVPPVKVVRAATDAFLPLSLPSGPGLNPGDRLRRATVRLRGEGGAILPLDLCRARPAATGRGNTGRVTFEIPLTDVGVGEWEVEASTAGAEGERATGTLFVCPPFAYLPPAIERGEKLFGFATQLYSLPDLDGFGVGTIAAAGRLASELGREYGASLFGLSPLHAIPNRDPTEVSPYCPDSRVWRNLLYLDLAACPEVERSPAAQAALKEPRMRQALEALERSPRVRYAEVYAKKIEILTLALGDFEGAGEPPSPRRQAFAAFLASGGEGLRRFAAFEARRGGDPRVHLFGQWLLEDQLETAQRALRAQGHLGFYQDLAVGSSGGGADAEADPELYIRGAEIGAPPDAFQVKGQAWGVAPMDPVRLRERAYGPFLKLLGASMRHSGAIRLDHVMALWRLWWVPAGEPATQGAYVEYPADDLLGLVALESWRNQCLVIGEDLGTVPAGVRERLYRERILGCRLVLFERDPAGAFRPPDQYPPLSVASFSSHDLPTFAGWWNGKDLELRARLTGGSSKTGDADPSAVRLRERQLLTALFETVLSGRGESAGTPWTLDQALAALHALLARTSSAVVLTSLEDALGLEEQRNVPGTLTEHPNWTGRIALSLDELLRHPRLRAAAEALRARRGASLAAR